MQRRLKSRIRIIFRFFKLPRRKLLLLIETFFYLSVAHFILCAFPFRRITPFLGGIGVETEKSSLPSDMFLIVQEVSNAIFTASKLTPWRNTCLIQAVSGKLMFKRRGIMSTMYLGVKKNLGEIEAHAWLRCGENIIIGAHNMESFTIVAKFGA